MAYAQAQIITENVKNLDSSGKQQLERLVHHMARVKIDPIKAQEFVDNLGKLTAILKPKDNDTVLRWINYTIDSPLFNSANISKLMDISNVVINWKTSEGKLPNARLYLEDIGGLVVGLGSYNASFSKKVNLVNMAMSEELRNLSASPKIAHFYGDVLYNVMKNQEFGNLFSRIIDPKMLEQAAALANDLLKTSHPGRTANLSMVMSVGYGLLTIGEANVRKLHEQGGVIHFARYSPQLLKAALENLDTKPSSSKPVAVISSSYYDWNGSFYQPIQNQGQITRFYRVVLVEYESDTEAIQRYSNTASSKGQIAALISYCHGTGGKMYSGHNYSIDPHQVLDSSDKNLLSSIGNCFSKQPPPTVILMSCHAGEGEDPIAKAMSAAWPSARVWSSTDELSHASSLVLAPNGEISSFIPRKGKGNPAILAVYEEDERRLLRPKLASIIPKKIGQGQKPG